MTTLSELLRPDRITDSAPRNTTTRSRTRMAVDTAWPFPSEGATQGPPSIVDTLIAEQAPPVAPIIPEAAPLPKVMTFEESMGKILEGNVNPSAPSEAIPMVLYKDFVEVEVEPGVKRHIPYKALKEIIDRTIGTVETSTSIAGTLLPSNVYFMSQTERELRLMCYYPGGNRDMLYNEEKLHIVAPNIVIAYTLKREKEDWIMGTEIYMCTDLPISKLPKTFMAGPDASKGLYLLPMSNTYDAGNMCYGNNQMPRRFKENNLRGMDWYFRFLWETPFNNDLGIRAVRDVGVGDWYRLLAKLAKAGKGFPYKDLRNWRAIDGAVQSTSELGNN